MGQQQPAFVKLDGCPAITDLDHLPRVFGLQKKLALIPARELVGPDEIQVLAVLPPDHRIAAAHLARKQRSEEHTSELQSLMRISYAVVCLKKKKKQEQQYQN